MRLILDFFGVLQLLEVVGILLVFAIHTWRTRERPPVYQKRRPF